MPYIALINQKNIAMKKILVILTLALFIGGTGITAYAASTNMPVPTEQNDDDKKKAKKKTSKKTTKSKDCSKSCDEKKTKDCSKECGGESEK